MHPPDQGWGSFLQEFLCQENSPSLAGNFFQFFVWLQERNNTVLVSGGLNPNNPEIEAIWKHMFGVQPPIWGIESSSCTIEWVMRLSTILWRSWHPSWNLNAWIQLGHNWRLENCGYCHLQICSLAIVPHIWVTILMLVLPLLESMWTLFVMFGLIEIKCLIDTLAFQKVTVCRRS